MAPSARTRVTREAEAVRRKRIQSLRRAQSRAVGSVRAPILSPTSLANRGVRRAFVRRVPAHRRLAAAVKSLPRRARLVLACAFIVLLYRLAAAALALPAAPREAEGHDGIDSSAQGATRAALGVPFAPSQVRRTAARVSFATGAVQEILDPPPPTHSRAAGLKYAQLWSKGAVARVDVPLGARVHFVAGERTGTLDRGDTCDDGMCEGIESVALEQDILFGLRHLRDSHPTDELILRIPSPHTWPEDSVTLVTQFSVSRLYRVEQTLAAWDGPVSLAIYLTDYADLALLDDFLRTDPARLAAFRSAALTVLKPNYAVSEPALVARLRYPINRLRNLALDLAPSPYVLVTDADFAPSPRMHALLAARGVPLLSARAGSPTLRRTAVVVSAFVLSSAANTSFPTTPLLLSAALDARPPLALLTDPNAGHGPSLPSLLLPPSSSAATSYDICYEPQWEPYYLLHRPSHPLYDERFSDQGGDKQAHTLLLNALGYDFKALRGVWFMHPPRGPIDDQWPAARLVDPSLDEEGHDLATHFNARAQRDTHRFRYFQDYVPEIESRFGRHFRWPRACPAGVVGVRSFGRARAGVVFGM